ncbi:MAG TPA: TIR domain-containing protein [Candidatus Baltobacteraceae bacterium]|nr:TIR domain-containing protein [Candidatus Baltobacteraceae bacterium]
MRRLSVPRWLRRTLFLIAVYAAVMYVFVQLPGGWHDWDWAAFNVLDALQHGGPAKPDPSIVYVDFMYDANSAAIPQRRRALATFITTAVSQKPRAIVLDFAFSRCPDTPCDAQYSRANEALLVALNAAHRSGVNVFATITEPNAVDDEGLPDNQPANKLDRAIYEALANYGHSGIEVHSGEKPPAYAGELYYHACIPFDRWPPLFSGSSLQEDIWSLVDVAADSDHESFPPPPGSPHVCNIRMLIPARYGAVISGAETHRITVQQPFPPDANFAGKFVIVGAAEHDVHEESHHPGPDLLAWAIGDERAFLRFDPATPDRPGALLFLVIAFSLITVGAFVALFFALRRLPLGALRSALPWIAAGLALGCGIVVFIAFEVAMFTMANKIQPQVSLVALGMLLAAVLCGVWGARMEFEVLQQIGGDPTREAYDWDVFISYAHEEMDWVVANVYEPLKRAQPANGRALKIFFDKNSIRYAAVWQDNIVHSIAGSRFVVAVFSEVYFSRPYCNWEIRRAYRKLIDRGLDSRVVFGVMRGKVAVPKAIDDIQYESIEDNPGLMDQFIAEITARLEQT